jgi:hypothetical protein
LREKNFTDFFNFRERGGMLCPRDDFYEKSPTQRHVDLASSSTRCTSPSFIFIFGCVGLDVSRQVLLIVVSAFLSTLRGTERNKEN